jgi:hypothetical protein
MNKPTKFNVFRYQELLTKTNSSKKEGKEFLQDPEVLELLACKSSVRTQIYYEQKTEYLDLIQKYLDETIPAGVFRSEFLSMSDKDRKKANKIFQNFEELLTFWIEPGLDKFSSLFPEIHDLCLSVVEFGVEEDGIPEDRFRNLIQKIFIELKDLYP